MLDRSLFLYGSNMGNSNKHDNYPLPEDADRRRQWQARGWQEPRRCRRRTPLANVHMTILDKLGIPQKSFGNSTGAISEV